MSNMRLVILIVILAFWAMVQNAEAQSTTTVTLTILPGPFIAELTSEEDVVVLTVNDLTGSGAGWNVAITCNGRSVVPVGITEVIAGMPIDGSHGPILTGSTLRADPEFGMGYYRQKFQECSGLWTITTVQGP